MKIRLLFLMLCVAYSTQAQNEFITTWKTDNPGVSEDNQITIPTHSGSTYDYSVDWGDGSSDSNVTGDITHTYASSGTYTVSITGLFPRIYFTGVKDEKKIISIDQWGDNEWTDFTWAFEDCNNLVIPVSAGAPNLANCRSFYGMFYDAVNFNSDISHWDVSNIKNMSETFYGCRSFNQPLNDWDVSGVTDFQGMFYDAQVFNQDLNEWDLSSAEDLSFMFEDAIAFNRDIGDWDLSTVTRINGMFSGATMFNQDLSGWDVSMVTNMRSMFKDAVSFDQNLGDWDITSVTSMDSMFTRAGLSTANYDSTLEGWATDNGSSFDGVDEVPQNIILDAGTSTYCNSESYRSLLVADYGWTITDGGMDCSTLHVNDLSRINIGLFPNPVINFIQLTGDTSNVSSLRIFDIQGKFIKSVYQNANQIDVSGLTQGVYFLKIVSGKKTQISKFIKE